MNRELNSLTIIQTESIEYIKNQIKKDAQIERQAEWLYRLVLTSVATTIAAAGFLAGFVV